MPVTNSKVFAVITGASRGIGKEIAVQLSRKVAAGSVFLITARQLALLQQVKTEILMNNAQLDVHVVVADAAYLTDEKLAEFGDVLSGAIPKGTHFDTLIMVHNAGTIGDLSKKAQEISTSKEWHDFLQINLIAMIQINNLVLSKLTKEYAVDKFQLVKQRLIVNITSLMSVQAVPSLSQVCFLSSSSSVTYKQYSHHLFSHSCQKFQYSVAKAAREAFFRSLAVEDPSLRILSYSPGPVQTDMYEDILQNSYDEGVRNMFQHRDPVVILTYTSLFICFTHDFADEEVSRKLLEPKETVSKMFSIIEKDQYESGARVDYFDVDVAPEKE
ncbi:unnamed protein product [Anisakis simplex]|uniref:Sepiapterin reductase (inferred by orthology to a human protein) n=1 Tax=Anisakis simplex TaxID=6269 RepID=A0A0M3K255_ANISI|nr:unnamed protein product [Anisakis simplex]